MNIRKPLKEVDGVIVEVNAAPGFRMHVAPSCVYPAISPLQLSICHSLGLPVACQFLAITGTNGKTTTSRLISHICRQTGKVVGFTTTDGVYIDDYLVEKGDNIGPTAPV
jgi:cyanophycin synthetase